ncbi:MAG: thiamine phosphate synthase [Clostridia bacterium]|nr:thiamine phosphate synthase [Clostridia bacterium]
MKPEFDSTLYFITDSTNFTEKEFLHSIESALQGGVTLLQLREKNSTTKDYISLARKVHEISSFYGIPLIIDDRVDVALASNAEGVHLGLEDISTSDARRICPDDMIIGATAKTVPWALDAQAQGADYVGVGAIFPTTTKVKTVITPISTLKDICQSVSIPVNAIGGLNSGNAHVLKGCGISGLCVVSAIMRSDDPKSEAKRLLNIARELKKSE